MTKEFNLSDKILESPTKPHKLYKKDVREFIKSVKELMRPLDNPCCGCAGTCEKEAVFRIIDKLAGEKLTQ